MSHLPGLHVHGLSIVVVFSLMANASVYPAVVAERAVIVRPTSGEILISSANVSIEHSQSLIQCAVE